ncbi:kelch repeat-containing protein [Croceimicrobium sp.]|uniref:kelch repeat-containing protein n=1 Tax=Croceimicrobium sp. TaxID=2828340 RepID=UPI003BAD16B3
MKNTTTLFSALLFSAGLLAQSQTWETLSGIPDGIHHPVTFAIGDYGYSVTGVSSFGAETDNAYRYNPVTDTWSNLTDFPGGARGFAIGLSYKGYGYLGFGASSSQYFKDLWRFDTSNNQWTQLADCGCVGRRHPALMAANDKIYLGLGNDNTGDLKDFWVYDIPTDSWTQLPDIPGPARHHPFMFATNGEVYAGMGHGGNFIYDDWYRFDTVNNNWQSMNNFPGEARVAGTQFDHAGYGYVLSGDGDNHSFMGTGEMWQYESGTDTWTELDPHPGFSRWAPGSFVIGDTLYFFGGFDRANSTFPTDMYKYFFNTNGIGLSELKQEASLFYPNPSTGIIRINPAWIENELKLYNLQGQLLQGWTKAPGEINLSNLPPAIYILELKDNKGQIQREKFWKK